MRIAVFAAAFPKTSTTFVLDHVTSLLDRGHDVHVFSRPPPPGLPVQSDFHRYRLADRTHYWHGTPHQRRDLAGRTLRLLGANPRENARVLLRSFNVLRYGPRVVGGSLWSYGSAVLSQEPFDVVLAEFGPLGRLAVQLRELGAFDAPIATTWLGYDLTQTIQRFGPRYYADLFRDGDVQLPLSENFGARLVKFGCPPERIRIHRVGVRVDQYEFTPRTLSPGEPLRIASVCRLTEKKGIDVGLRALSRAAKRGVRFEYHLVGDGPGRAELERLRDELGLAGVTTLYGARTREEIRTLLARCHLFLAPSVTAADGDEEGTPVAIMEAMASGLPVLSTVHSGIPEMIEDGVSGALVPERDDAALAESIVRLASAPSEWPALARRARQAIEERYDAERLNDSLSTLLTELGHQRRRPGAAPSGRAARGDFA